MQIDLHSIYSSTPDTTLTILYMFSKLHYSLGFREIAPYLSACEQYKNQIYSIPSDKKLFLVLQLIYGVSGWVLQFPQIMKGDFYAVIELSLKSFHQVTWESRVKELEIAPALVFIAFLIFKGKHLLGNNLHICLSFCEGTIYLPSTFVRII